MDIDLRAHLLADAPLSALVGTRIDWVESPQGSANPRVTLLIVSAPIEYHLQGEISLQTAIVQVDAWADKYASGYAVRRALMASLSAFVGTVGNTKFHGIFVENQRSTVEKGVSDDARIFRESIDIIVNFERV